MKGSGLRDKLVSRVQKTILDVVLLLVILFEHSRCSHNKYSFREEIKQKILNTLLFIACLFKLYVMYQHERRIHK
jgi:hypothetical protein